MRVLIAPDKFKGSLSGREVAEEIAAGIRDVLPNARIDLMPLADGGEGTAEAICQARGGKWVTCKAHDALGRTIEARYVWLCDSASAVMEMSEAAGLWRISPDERDPLRAHTFGVGEMLLDAASRGATEIMIGLGGSATNDGGFGLARSLGYRFIDSADKELTNGPAELVKLNRILGTGDDVRSLPMVAATDVRNPLLGLHGATRVFGPQKGATSEQLEVLETALTRLGETVVRDLRVDFRAAPGAGAAGGLGFGLMSFCGASLRLGFEVVAEAIGLRGAMSEADVVVTGEGRLDRQTLNGKAPAGVAQIARSLGKPVFAIVGRVEEDRAVRELFDGVLELDGPIPEARERLRQRARELAGEFGKMP